MKTWTRRRLAAFLALEYKGDVRETAAQYTDRSNEQYSARNRTAYTYQNTQWLPRVIVFSLRNKIGKSK